MVILGVLFGFYNFWVLEKVRHSHGREMAREAAAVRAKESLRERLRREAREPALEPGSVV